MATDARTRKLEGELRETRAQLADAKKRLRASDASRRRMAVELAWFHAMFGQGVLDRGGLPGEALARQALDSIIADGKKLALATSLGKEMFAFVLGLLMERIAAADAPLFSDASPDPGNRCKLTEAQALLLSLVRKRHGPTQALLGVVFGIDQSTVSRYLEFVDGILVEVLPVAERIRERLAGLAPGSGAYGYLVPGREILVDGTRVRVQRPQDGDARRGAHSGKARDFTANIAIVANGLSLVLHAGPPHAGSTHDMAALRPGDPDLGAVTASPKDPSTPPGRRVTVRVGLGHGGVERMWPGGTVERPDKRRAGQKLTRAQRARNRRKAGARMTVEHAICRIKRFRIMTRPYDGTPEGLHREVQIATGLANLHLLWDRRNKRLMHGF